MMKRVVSMLLVLAMLFTLMPAVFAEGEANSDFEISGNKLVRYNGSSSSVTVPAEVEVIGSGAFLNNRNITSVRFAGEVTTIQSQAFAGCVNLAYVSFANFSKLESIGSYAFAGCLPMNPSWASNVPSVAGNAFDGCSVANEPEVPAEPEEPAVEPEEPAVEPEEPAVEPEEPAVEPEEPVVEPEEPAVEPEEPAVEPEEPVVEPETPAEPEAPVEDLVSQPRTELAITKQPKDVTVPSGEKAVVSFEAVGDGLTYTWYYSNNGGGKFYKTTTFTSNVYEVTMSSSRDGRMVYCVVTDAAGNTVQTNTVTLAMGEAVVEPEAVKITKQPVDVKVPSGEQAIVSFEATGDGLTYTWYYSNNGGAKFSKTSSFTSNVYEVTMSSSRDGRMVYCVVTDAYGNTAQTNKVTLSMGEDEPEEPTVTLAITKQLEDVAVAEGEQAIASFEAVGEGLTYTWYYSNNGGSKFSVTDSYKTNVYTVTMTTGRNGRMIYCVVTDAYGNSVQTETITLSIKAEDTVELAITKQPESVTVPEGKQAIVSFDAVGEGLTYAWYYSNNGGSKFYLTTSYTTNVYTVTMTSGRNGRMIYCVVTDAYGNSVQTDTVTLSMEAEQTKLEIVTQPVDVAVLEGEKAVVSFEAVGDDLTYTWYFSNNGGAKFSKTTTFVTNVYEVVMSSSRNGRMVYCVVTDAYGNTVQTDTVTLSMLEPATPLEITKQPESVTVAEGEQAIVSFEATGDDLTYAWYYSNNGGAKFYLTTSYTTNVYTVTMTSGRNGRMIYCVITDAHGNSVQTDTVSLNMITELKEGDFVYEIVEETITIVRYDGTDASVVVPATIADLPVTVIGASAFEGNTTLTSIDLPDSIQVIGRRAFANCTKLAEIN